MREQNPIDSEYDRLPAVVQANVTRKEYAWLSNDQRHRLLDDFTEPSGNWVDE